MYVMYVHMYVHMKCMNSRAVIFIVMFVIWYINPQYSNVHTYKLMYVHIY